MVSDKATYWQLHITKQENSEPSIKRYCQQADISENQFYYWRKKLQRKKSHASSCIPVHIQSSEEAMPPICTLTLRGGHRLAFHDVSFVERFLGRFL